MEGGMSAAMLKQVVLGGANHNGHSTHSLPLPSGSASSRQFKNISVSSECVAAIS